MSCGVGRGGSFDPELLWLRSRPKVTAQTGLLAWEPLYAMGSALKRPPPIKRMYICMTESLCCTAEIGKTLQINYNLKKERYSISITKHCLVKGF